MFTAASAQTAVWTWTASSPSSASTSRHRLPARAGRRPVAHQRRGSGARHRRRSGHDLPFSPGDAGGGGTVWRRILTAIPNADPRRRPADRQRHSGAGTARAIWSEIEIDGVALNVFNTHLGLVPREQRLQATALTGPGWLGGCAGPTLLAGDFNATSITRPYQTLCRSLEDCQRQLGVKPSVKTFPSAFPAIRIDPASSAPHSDTRGALGLFAVGAGGVGSSAADRRFRRGSAGA